MKKTVAMIPARSGSQGLKDKNILNLSGRPIISHSILPALNCNAVDKVYLNSESDKYLSIGQKYGAIGYKRNLELSSNLTTMKSVVQDFCTFIKNEDEDVDCIVILYPTYPFRESIDISNFIDKFREIGSNRSVVGLKEPDTHPCLIYHREDSGKINNFNADKCKDMYRRQEYPLVYELTHWITVVPVEGLSTLNNQMIDENTYGYRLENKKGKVDIDSVDDYLYAQYLLDKGIL